MKKTLLPKYIVENDWLDSYWEDQRSIDDDHYAVEKELED